MHPGKHLVARVKAASPGFIDSFVQTRSGKTIYSFLSIGCGFLSDVDVESERLRFMGEPRFMLWAIYRIINFRSYKLRLSYKLHTPLQSEESRSSPSPRLFH